MASIVEGFEDSFHTDMPETGTGHEHLAKGKQSIQDNISQDNRDLETKHQKKSNKIQGYKRGLTKL